MNTEKTISQPVKRTIFTFKSKKKNGKQISTDPTGTMTGTGTCSTCSTN